MMGRTQMAHVLDRLKGELAEARAEAEKWKERATQANVHAAECARELDAMRSRLKEVEAQAARKGRRSNVTENKTNTTVDSSCEHVLDGGRACAACIIRWKQSLVALGRELKSIMDSDYNGSSTRGCGCDMARPWRSSKPEHLCDAVGILKVLPAWLKQEIE